MPTERESTLILSIRNRSKAVSYSGSDQRPDGGQNYGFKPLKGKLEDCALIPEVQDDAALKNALISLNQSDSIFFTVACEKSCNQHGSGYQKKGYVEVASNDGGLAINAAYYFQLFYEFNRNWFWKQTQGSGRALSVRPRSYKILEASSCCIHDDSVDLHGGYAI